MASSIDGSTTQESADFDRPASLAAAVWMDGNRLIVIVVAVVAVAALIAAQLLVARFFWRPARAPNG
ncbi:hypothetical protein SBADM41S_00933 [Streptomyces badius]